MDIGVPQLAALADELDIRFTFFALMGRAVMRRRLLRSDGARQDATTLPAKVRFGLRRTAAIALLNPLVGARRLSQLRKLTDLGHEVGLHGGRNHREWMDEAPRWSLERLRSEISWGAGLLRRAGIEPFGFASPGAVGPPMLPFALQSLGYRYVSDRLRQGEVGLTREPDGLASVPVSVLGDPGGVGYLEWARAHRFSDAQLLDDFKRRLQSGGNNVVAYDHPAWAGVHDLARVRTLVDTARAEGFDVTTTRHMVEVPLS